MIVRKMNAAELDVTINVFGYYRDEAIESLPKIEDEYDENSVIDTIRTYASHWDHIWLNAYVNTRPVGFVAGYISACPWNKKILDANIGFIYLLPSHRNMDNFRELLTHFEEWARMAGATNLTAGDIGINPERFKKLFEHMGFKERVLMEKGIE
jgi:GNAT superfamily N-acetyltransferase